MTDQTKSPDPSEKPRTESIQPSAGANATGAPDISGELWQSQRIVYIVGLILTIVMTFASLLDLAVLLYNQFFPPISWHPTVAGVLLLSAAAACAFVATWQARKGRPYLGAMLIIGITLFDLLAIAVVTELPTIPLTIGVVIITAELAYLTLPGRWMRWAILASLLIGTFSILIWVNRWQPGQAETTGAQIFVISLLVILILIFGIMIGRRIAAFPLRARVTLSFLAVSMLPLAALGLLNVRQLSTLLETDTSNLLSDTSWSAAYALNVFLEDRLAAARTQAQLPDVSDCLYQVQQAQVAAGDVEAALQSDACKHAEQILLSLASQDPVYGLSYGLLDRAGIDMVDTRPENVGGDESAWSYYKIPVQEGIPEVSDVLFVSPGQTSGTATGSTGDTPSLYIGVPVRTAGGVFVGVFRIQYPASALQLVVAESFGYGGAARPSQDLYVVLLDGTTYLRLAHSSDPTLIYKTYAPLTPQQVVDYQAQGVLPPGSAEELTTNQPEVVTGIQGVAPANHNLTPVDPVACNSCHPAEETTRMTLAQEAEFTAGAAAAGVDTAVSLAILVPDTSWVMMARQSVAASQALRQDQIRLLVLLALLTAWVVGGISLVIAGYQTRPILKLTEVAQRVAEGDLSARAEVGAQDEIGVLSATFNSMTGELQDTLATLEQRVADRTRAIELSADVSRRLSTIIDPAQLASEVVELLQFAFEYYHVHIYLYDEVKQYLVMAGGTGEAGRTMLERGHKIERGHGLVGRACEEGLVVLVPDTSLEPAWLPNPLLPETRAEIAVPIMVGDEVLGALDVQQNRVGGLGEQDADLLRGIAGQLAIALRNARTYAETQRQAERQAQLTDIVQQVQATQTIQEALQIAVRELGRAVDASRTHIRVNLVQPSPASPFAATGPSPAQEAEGESEAGPPTEQTPPGNGRNKS